MQTMDRYGVGNDLEITHRHTDTLYVTHIRLYKVCVCVCASGY